MSSTEHVSHTHDAEGQWERYTRGIGSRLLRKWGHQPGSSLGKHAYENAYSPPSFDTSSTSSLRLSSLSIEPLPKRSRLSTPPTSPPSIVSAPSVVSTPPSPSPPSISNDDAAAALRDSAKTLGLRSREVSEQAKSLEDDVRARIVLMGTRSGHEAFSPHISLAMPPDDNLEAFSKSLDYFTTTLEKIPHNINLDALVAMFTSLREEHPSEFSQLALGVLGTTMALPLILAEIAEWWVPVISDKHMTDGHDEEEVGDYGHLTERYAYRWQRWRNFFRSTLDVHSAHLWGEAVDAVVDRLRAHLQAVWHVRDASRGVQLVETWTGLLPTGSIDGLLAGVVLPRLLAEITTWQPLEDKQMPAEWVGPWSPPHLLGSQLEDVYWIAVQQLTDVLRQRADAWDASDTSVMAMVRAWADVLPPAFVHKLVREAIEPRLATQLAEVGISSKRQDSTAFRHILAWTSIVGASVIASLLARCFFPRWLSVLHQWMHHLSPHAVDYDEVRRWYLAWRGILPSSVRGHQEVKECLVCALEMIEHALPAGI